MGSERGSWAGLIAVWAIAILVAALGRAPAAPPPVERVVVVDAVGPLATRLASPFVASE